MRESQCISRIVIPVSQPFQILLPIEKDPPVRDRSKSMRRVYIAAAAGLALMLAGAVFEHRDAFALQAPPVPVISDQP